MKISFHKSVYIHIIYYDIQEHVLHAPYYLVVLGHLSKHFDSMRLTTGEYKQYSDKSLLL